MTAIVLKHGRNEFTLNIDGAAFYVVYDRAPIPSTSPSPSTSTGTASAAESLNPYVLLSHALMANLTMYDSTITALNAKGYDTLRYDQLGHGNSSTGEEGRKWHFDDFARHMHLICERVRPGVRPRALVGCSMGGVLAVRYAMLFGEGNEGGGGKGKGEGKEKEKEKLKVVCIGAPGMKSLEESIPKWEERKALFREKGVGELVKKTAARWFPDPVPEGVRERAEEMCRTCTLEGYERCAEGIVSYDYEGELDDVREYSGVDVLVVRGENDEAVGDKSILEDVARRVGGRFVEMKGVGHLPPVHDERGFEKWLMQFLDG